MTEMIAAGPREYNQGSHDLPNDQYTIEVASSTDSMTCRTWNGFLR